MNIRIKHGRKFVDFHMEWMEIKNISKYKQTNRIFLEVGFVWTKLANCNKQIEFSPVFHFESMFLGFVISSILNENIVQKLSYNHRIFISIFFCLFSPNLTCYFFQHFLVGGPAKFTKSIPNELNNSIPTFLETKKGEVVWFDFHFPYIFFLGLFTITKNIVQHWQILKEFYLGWVITKFLRIQHINMELYFQIDFSY